MLDNAENDEIKDPNKAQEWLDLIEDAERYFRDYLDSCDNIDRLYSDLATYRSGQNDRDFALFWSNIQVMGPSIYARPPQPVVTPKFKDRRPVYRTASELLERVATVAFDMADINEVMLQCRDDLTICGRGVAWVRDDDDGKVCIEHLDRRDFLHEPARKWQDVSWVARRGWLSYDEMEERFGEEVAAEVSYQTRDNGNKFGPQDCSKKCGVWEIWHKGHDKVVWVTPGVEDVLEIDEPHLKIEGFFPCPQPAYATLQRRTLIPIADVIYYKGQLEQINLATARIHALSNALQMKGLYPGGGEIGEAIEAAMAAEDDGRVLIPVSSMAAFGQGGDPVVWLPIDMVASTLTALVEFRRQIIDDVYQIIGLSDIMRGATEASETATAQQIKQQNGSYRVRDKQNELVRLSRDLVRITCEIIAENYSRKELEDMAQMDLPSKADIDKQLREVKGQLQALNAEIEGAASDPQVQAMKQQNPEAFQQAIEQAQAQLQQLQQQAQELESTVTMDAVIDFLRDQKLRPFVLDIETDSTIYPDEMQEKASRAELLQVVMGTMPAVAQLAALGPQALALAGGVLKFALAPYRVGRELDGLVDDFVDSAPQIAQQMQQAQGGGEDQEAMKQLAQAETEKARAQMAKVEADTALKQAEMQQKMAQMQIDTQEKQAKFQLESQKLAQKNDELGMKYEELQARIDNIRADTMKKVAEAGVIPSDHALDQFKSLADIELKAAGMQQQAQQREVDTAIRVSESERNAGMSERQQALAERQAMEGKNG